MQFFDGSDLNNELKQVNLSTLSNNYAARCNQLRPLKEEEMLKCCLVGNHYYSTLFNLKRSDCGPLMIHNNCYFLNIGLSRCFALFIVQILISSV